MIKAVKGYKTYLSAMVMIILTGAHVLHYIDDSTYTGLMAIAGSCGLMALRSAIPPTN